LISGTAVQSGGASPQLLGRRPCTTQQVPPSVGKLMRRLVARDRLGAHELDIGGERGRWRRRGGGVDEQRGWERRRWQ
jgi:hypothetical protein